MPAVAAAPLLWTAIAGAAGAGATAAANIYGSHKQSEASAEANKTTAASNAAAIAEQQRQDAVQKQEFDAQQSAAKAQWDAQQAIRAPYRAAGASALGSLGDILGVNFNSGNSPSYASPAQPTATGAPSGPSGSSAAPAVDWTAPAPVLAQNLSAYFKAKGVPDTEVPYWVSKAPELVARGQELKDPAYADKRLSQANIFGGQSGGTAPISAVMPRPALAPQLSPISANALAPSYTQAVPISSLMGAR